MLFFGGYYCGVWLITVLLTFLEIKVKLVELQQDAVAELGHAQLLSQALVIYLLARAYWNGGGRI